jgi:hypothetical protein
MGTSLAERFGVSWARANPLQPAGRIGAGLAADPIARGFAKVDHQGSVDEDHGRRLP